MDLMLSLTIKQAELLEVSVPASAANTVLEQWLAFKH
jgi:hypothetical protein